MFFLDMDDLLNLLISLMFLSQNYTSANLHWRKVTYGHIGRSSYFLQMICNKSRKKPLCHYHCILFLSQTRSLPFCKTFHLMTDTFIIHNFTSVALHSSRISFHQFSRYVLTALQFGNFFFIVHILNDVYFKKTWLEE